MGDLRSEAMAQKYKSDIDAGMFNHGCVLCTLEPIQQFRFWKLVTNKYPYDKIAKKHDMIIPLRHTDLDGITAEEWEELSFLKSSFINENYEFLIEATPHRQSIPGHFHLHTIVSRD